MLQNSYYSIYYAIYQFNLFLEMNKSRKTDLNFVGCKQAAHWAGTRAAQRASASAGALRAKRSTRARQGPLAFTAQWPAGPSARARACARRSTAAPAGGLAAARCGHWLGLVQKGEMIYSTPRTHLGYRTPPAMAGRSPATAAETGQGSSSASTAREGR